jgi:hypothetical protein
LCCITFAFPFVFFGAYFSCHSIGWVVSSFLGGKGVLWVMCQANNLEKNISSNKLCAFSCEHLLL